MAIIFKTLATQKNADQTNTLPEPGKYPALIKKAEVKKGSNGDYLNILLEVQDVSTNQKFNVYDMLKDSDKPLLQYKLRRILEATKLFSDLENTELELADLGKLLENRKLLVDIKIEPAKDKYPAKAVVDAFKDEIYYPDDEGSVQLTMIDPFNNIINAADAEDL